MGRLADVEQVGDDVVFVHVECKKHCTETKNAEVDTLIAPHPVSQ